MYNMFKLSLPENGFGFPCNICAGRNEPAESCRNCTGYSGSFDIEISDIRKLMETTRALPKK